MSIDEALRGIALKVADALTEPELAEVLHLLDHSERGLALEFLAEFLSERQAPISSGIRAEMLALVREMGMDDLVERALALCPTEPG